MTKNCGSGQFLEAVISSFNYFQKKFLGNFHFILTFISNKFLYYERTSEIIS